MKVFANYDSVLSSAKLCTKAYLMYKTKSLQNVLNRIGLTNEP